MRRDAKMRRNFGVCTPRARKFAYVRQFVSEQHELQLTPDELAATDGRIPLDDFALKVYGTDELLDDDAPLDRHICVGVAVAADKDVLLEVGRRTLPLVATSVPILTK